MTEKRPCVIDFCKITTMSVNGDVAAPFRITGTAGCFTCGLSCSAEVSAYSQKSGDALLRKAARETFTRICPQYPGVVLGEWMFPELLTREELLGIFPNSKYPRVGFDNSSHFA